MTRVDPISRSVPFPIVQAAAASSEGAFPGDPRMFETAPFGKKRKGKEKTACTCTSCELAHVSTAMSTPGPTPNKYNVSVWEGRVKEREGERIRYIRREVHTQSVEIKASGAPHATRS